MKRTPSSLVVGVVRSTRCPGHLIVSVLDLAAAFRDGGVTVVSPFDTPMVRDDEPPLTQRIFELACLYGRYGYRRVTALLRDDGWYVNHKRVERIWKQEGLREPKKQPKRGRLWLNDGSCVRLRPEQKDHVWSYDFVQARTHDGRAFRMLTVIDEYTRECLAMDVARRLKSDDVLERLAWLMATRGVTGHVWLDNWAEYTA